MTVASALRRAVAALVLFGAVLIAVDLATYKEWHPSWGFASLPAVPAMVKSIHMDCSRSLCYSTRPTWTIPVAIAIGLVGILVAARIYRPRAARASALSGQPAILRADERHAAAWGLAPPHA